MTNNLNIVMVIYLYKFEVFWQFFVVKKLSDVLNITILDIYIYIYFHYSSPISEFLQEFPNFYRNFRISTGISEFLRNFRISTGIYFALYENFGSDLPLGQKKLK